MLNLLAGMGDDSRLQYHYKEMDAIYNRETHTAALRSSACRKTGGSLSIDKAAVRHIITPNIRKTLMRASTPHTADQRAGGTW